MSELDAQDALYLIKNDVVFFMTLYRGEVCGCSLIKLADALRTIVQTMEIALSYEDHNNSAAKSLAVMPL